MRLLRPALPALLLAAACAHVESPPGGPEDAEPPRLLATRPDTMARLQSYQGPVVFVFSEGISEQNVEQAVTVSPRTSAVDVDKSGDEIRVSLRRGWERGRVYQVNVAAQVRDLFGNVIAEPIRLVFSTGPEIPNTRATGVVVQRTTGQPLVGGRVEATLLPDSLVYTVITDSAGGFELRQVPEGEYRLRAYSDVNRNLELEEFEPRDTATVRVSVAAPPPRRLLAVLLPDSTPPRAGTATAVDEWVEVRFDDYLDPGQPLSPSQVTLTGPAGPVQVAEVRVGRPPALDRDTAERDTAAAARPDTAPAARDTARRDTL
ncbi:MAG TPA: Ig-like domain-containing protein, partial [Longimicrobiaceae bacterium]|nr:Ig-like domain-containing protein [Longimicrobiaceae bacterium]